MSDEKKQYMPIGMASDKTTFIRPPTGAQVMAEQAAAQQHLRKIIDDHQLRKWCVEQALKCQSCDVENMTIFFYDFVTKSQEKPDEKGS